MGMTTAVLRSEAPLIAGISLIQLVDGYIGTLIGVRLASAGVEPPSGRVRAEKVVDTIDASWGFS